MVKANIQEVVIDGKTYVPKSEYQKAEQLEGMDYVLVRGDRSGVFAGYLESRNKQEVVLLNARRIWYWSGAASLSQLAEDGTSDPDNCKFPKAVSKIQILDVIEILNCSETAKKSICAVVEWKK